jgi:hypothetical protein
VIIRRFIKCCVADDMEEGKMRKLLKKQAVNMRQVENCEDTKAETGNMRPVQKVSDFIFSQKNQSRQVGKSHHSGGGMQKNWRI